MEKALPIDVAVIPGAALPHQYFCLRNQAANKEQVPTSQVRLHCPAGKAETVKSCDTSRISTNQGTEAAECPCQNDTHLSMPPVIMTSILENHGHSGLTEWVARVLNNEAGMA